MSYSIDLLKKNTLFWSRLGFEYDPAIMDENNKLLSFNGDYNEFARFHRDLHTSGVKIHTSILFSGWTGPEQYDYELTDRTLKALFDIVPDALYIPRIKLNVPLLWSKKYPEELFVYYGGPDTVEEIDSMVGSLKHDYLGYEAPDGYFQGEDNRPNVGGLISNQSFASKKWLEDAGIALKKLIKHIKSGPYADKIIGYHVAYGACGETILWGRQSERFGDYGIVAKKEFYQWGLGKYGSKEKLETTWLQQGLSEKTIQIPPPEVRSGCTGSLEEFFRARPEDRIVIDYDCFMSDVNVKAIDYFAKIVKDETDGQALVGVFYGYILECFNSAYTGHLALNHVLDSPYIDFIAAPKSYYRCHPGEPGGVIAPAQSINRKKLWVDELDNRTHIAKEINETKAANLYETKTILWREFSKNMAHNSALWWMDLGGSWYDDPALHNIVKNIQTVYDKLKDISSKNIAEILLVVDDESICHYSSHSNFHTLLMQEFIREAHLCGAPVDIYRLDDLTNLNLDNYKMVCFLNCFKIDRYNQKIINKKLNDNTLRVWFYAPGILNHDFSIDNIQKLIDIPVRKSMYNFQKPEITFLNGEKIKYELSEDALDLPAVEVQETDNITVLAHFDNKKIAGAKHGQNVYFALPLLKSTQIRHLAELANVHLYAPDQCTVYGDSRFIGVFPKIDIDSQLLLKSKLDLKQINPNKQWINENVVPLKLDAKNWRFFMTLQGETKNV